MSKPKLKKSLLKLRQFDGSFIKTLGCFEGTLETDAHSKIIPIRLLKCEKCHRHMRIDGLKVNTIKLINSVRLKSNDMGMLKEYMVSIQLKENSQPSYIESHRLPIHILHLVVAKLKTMVEQRILEQVPSGDSN